MTKTNVETGLADHTGTKGIPQEHQAKNHYNSNDDIWDIEIKPKSGLFDLNLREVWNYRDLTWLFVKRDFVAKYKQTVLGPLWHVIQPSLTTMMNVFLFNLIAGIGTDGKNKVLFQMAGTIIWSYFSVCLINISGTFTSNANIFGKVYFPRLVTPISIVISNIVQFGIMMGLLIAAMLFFYFRGSEVTLGAFWMVPVVIFILAGIALGLGIIISSMTTKYRDLAVLVAFGVQLLAFASAVQYPISVLMQKFADKPWLFNLVKWNPLSVLVETFRNAMLGGPINYNMVLYAFVFMVVSLFFGTLIFNKVEKSFMDTV